MSSRTFKLITGASTNLTEVGTTSAQVTGIVCSNINATAGWLKLYWGNTNNFSSAKDVPTVGTDVPAFTVGIPAGTATAPGTVIINWTGDAGPRGNGNMFMACTGASTDGDSTSAAAGIVINITWQ